MRTIWSGCVSRLTKKERESERRSVGGSVGGSEAVRGQGIKALVKEEKNWQEEEKKVSDTCGGSPLHTVWLRGGRWLTAELSTGLDQTRSRWASAAVNSRTVITQGLGGCKVIAWQELVYSQGSRHLWMLRLPVQTEANLNVICVRVAFLSTNVCVYRPAASGAIETRWWKRMEWWRLTMGLWKLVMMMNSRKVTFLAVGFTRCFAQRERVLDSLCESSCPLCDGIKEKHTGRWFHTSWCPRF